MPDLDDSITALRETIDQHRREILRLHPEVADLTTVEILKRELAAMMKAYSDLLARHAEVLKEER